MFPWNYGFHWGIATYLFLGAFYVVLAVVAVTVLRAVLRARRDLRANRTELIRWHSDFQELPAADRVCRHVLTGEFTHRECPNAFDCRQCATHAKLMEHRPAAARAVSGTAAGSVSETAAGTAAEAQDDFFGMSFPPDRFYHRGHAWARPEADGTVTIGLDDLGARLLGTPDAVVLPEPGTQLHANGTAFRVRRREADVRILSPVDGEVVETGGADRGYFLRVMPSACGPACGIDMRHLLSGGEVRPWLRREMERLQLALTMEGSSLPSLADGGVPVRDIAAAYPRTDWDAVCGEMFLEP